MAIGYLLKGFLGRDREQRNADSKRNVARECEIFSSATLSAATNKFATKLGQGGSGSVYKGKLKDGREVAVKVLKETIQGTKEFENEVKLLSSLGHPNVVKLLGYCAPGKKKLPVYEHVVKLLGCYAPPGKKNLLVYEYVPNNNLGQLLSQQQLDWQQKYAIIQGIARGLNHVHHQSDKRIIHRDIKPANILIDGDLNPKIADFGLSRTLPPEKSHVTTSCRGTYGYIAPELHRGLRHVTMKSDVYSFGVVLLEIVSGSGDKFFDFQTLDVSKNRFIRVHKLYENGNILEFTDRTLSTQAEIDQLKKCIKIGLQCTEVDPKLRPTMKEVISMFTMQQPQPDCGDCGTRVGRFRSLIMHARFAWHTRRSVAPANPVLGGGDAGDEGIPKRHRSAPS